MMKTEEVSPNEKMIPVVAGILWRKSSINEIEIFFARRPTGKPFAGYLEFPGGKCEPDESLEVALVRELQEELGITVIQQTFWDSVIFTYPHAVVHLHFFWVDKWLGTPEPREKQGLFWQALSTPFAEDVLPATLPLEKKIRESLEKHVNHLEQK
jgi:8-oxo-dGTP diphosphatase